MIADFHFLRPWWLLALPPALTLICLMKHASDTHAMWKGIIADHLLPYLVQGSGGESAIRGPFILMAAAAAITCLILAGPSWQKEKSPFAEDAAPLAVVMQISPSMKTEDIAPDRLTRSFQKVHDLLARRPGSKTALIAYAGSAHLVMPLTTDAAVIDTFAAALDPSIMPITGDAAAEALALADKALPAGGGSILWIACDIEDGQLAPLRQWRKSSAMPVKLLCPLADTRPLELAADAADADIIHLTPDDADVSLLERASKSAPSADPSGGSARWQDEGYPLTPLPLLLLLPFFRRGWMPPIAARS